MLHSLPPRPAFSRLYYLLQLTAKVLASWCSPRNFLQISFFFEITKSKLTKKVYMDKVKINCFPQNRYMRNHLAESVARVTEPPNGWGWKAHIQLSVLQALFHQAGCPPPRTGAWGGSSPGAGLGFSLSWISPACVGPSEWQQSLWCMNHPSQFCTLSECALSLWSLMEMLNSIRASIDPWGTLLVTAYSQSRCHFTSTLAGRQSWGSQK